MLHNRILRETTHESAEFVSPICIVKKLDGRVRLILNLKELHEFFKYEHFTMDGIKAIIHMVTRNCFMATTAFKDAYYSVAVGRLFQKFLKFKWKDKLYYFTCFPNGLGSCSIIKLNKVPVATLHFENVPLGGYIDDFFTKGETFSNVKKTYTKQCVCMGFSNKFIKVQN